MPNFDMALVVTVEAFDYEDALQIIDNIAAGLGHEGENVSAASYEYNHTRAARRLPAPDCL